MNEFELKYRPKQNKDKIVKTIIKTKYPKHWLKVILEARGHKVESITYKLEVEG